MKRTGKVTGVQNALLVAPVKEANEPAAAPTAPTESAGEERETRPVPTGHSECLVDSNNCMEPAAPDHTYRDADDRCINAALGFPPAADALAVVVVHPSFQWSSMLSLHRRANRGYFLRLTRLRDPVGEQLAVDMSKAPGQLLQLPPECAGDWVGVTRAIVESDIDATTAELLIRMSGALVRRAQVVEASQDCSTTGHLDGVDFYFRQGRRAGIAQQGDGVSVLDQAVIAIRRLLDLAEASTPPPREELDFVREQMRAALNRTLRREPCLRPQSGER